MVSERVGDTCPGSYFCPRLGSPQLDHLVWTVNYPLCSGRGNGFVCVEEGGGGNDVINPC